MSVITIERKVLEKNDQVAGRNRALFQERGIFALNFVSSPGAGKTSILEKTFQVLQGSMRMAVIEGDVQTDLDAQRVARYGVPVIQIVTLGGCHLDAPLVQDAMTNLDLSKVDLLFIENVGNLVCPANYDLGEALKVVILSTTEGDDKPLKYPGMFLNSSVLIINKTDLVPYVKCDMNVLRGNALRINPSLKVFEMSCFTGDGIQEWCDWLKRKGAPEQ
ncbi:MAG: hydrogenase nickel incorporation protein HypB [Acidobacteriota bacterium]|jgi:hydrogenase nickel incorporation protein HypB|nr:hydrogenase nickel incorporation protein HypB [Acidobacteriota bacterium]